MVCEFYISVFYNDKSSFLLTNNFFIIFKKYLQEIEFFSFFFKVFFFFEEFLKIIRNYWCSGLKNIYLVLIVYFFKNIVYLMLLFSSICSLGSLLEEECKRVNFNCSSKRIKLISWIISNHIHWSSSSVKWICLDFLGTLRFGFS